MIMCINFHLFLVLLPDNNTHSYIMIVAIVTMQPCKSSLEKLTENEETKLISEVVFIAKGMRGI